MQKVGLKVSDDGACGFYLVSIFSGSLEQNR